MTTAAPEAPAPLLEHLTDEDRLIIPVGPSSRQELQLLQRHGQRYDCEAILPVVFVPLRGRLGCGKRKNGDTTDENNCRQRLCNKRIPPCSAAPHGGAEREGVQQVAAGKDRGGPLRGPVQIQPYLASSEMRLIFSRWR